MDALAQRMAQVTDPDILTHLVLEITERGEFPTPEAIAKLRAMRALYGFKIALDDYPPDKFNCQQVADLQPDFIKVDGDYLQKKIFVFQGDGQTLDEERLIQELKLLQKQLLAIARSSPNCLIVLEWTETEQQYRVALGATGADAVQSYKLEWLLRTSPQVMNFIEGSAALRDLMEARMQMSLRRIGAGCADSRMIVDGNLGGYGSEEDMAGGCGYSR